VLTRLQRAALCVAWSPCERRFAVGSGAKNCCVCAWEPDHNWWLGRMIRKHHGSSLLCLAWHPGAVWLATGCADRKCRVFCAGDASQPGARAAEVAWRPRGAR